MVLVIVLNAKRKKIDYNLGHLFRHVLFAEEIKRAVNYSLITIKPVCNSVNKGGKFLKKRCYCVAGEQY